MASVKGLHKMKDLWTEEHIEKNDKGKVTVVNDTQADPRVNAAAYGAMNILSFLTIPLARDGVFKFMVGIPDTKPRQWRGDEIALAKEVTERIWTRLEKARAEDALRQSEARYEALFAASPAPFLVVAPNPPDFTITAVNDAYVAATLITRKALIGQNLLDVFTYDLNHPGRQDSGAVAHSISQVLATRPMHVMERLRYDLVSPDGELQPTWWLAVNAPMLDAHGNVLAIIHQATPVTEQYYAELALRETREQLELSISAGKVGIWTHDVKNNYLHWNKQQCELYGINENEFGESPEAFWNFVLTEDGQRLEEETAKEVADRQLELVHQFRIKRKDGKVRWKESRNRTQFDEQGKPLYTIGINLDITAEKSFA